MIWCWLTCSDWNNGNPITIFTLWSSDNHSSGYNFILGKEGTRRCFSQVNEFLPRKAPPSQPIQTFQLYPILSTLPLLYFFSLALTLSNLLYILVISCYFQCLPLECKLLKECWSVLFTTESQVQRTMPGIEQVVNKYLLNEGTPVFHQKWIFLKEGLCVRLACVSASSQAACEAGTSLCPHSGRIPKVRLRHVEAKGGCVGPLSVIRQEPIVRQEQ